MSFEDQNKAKNSDYIVEKVFMPNPRNLQKFKLAYSTVKYLADKYGNAKLSTRVVERHHKVGFIYVEYIPVNINEKDKPAIELIINLADNAKFSPTGYSIKSCFTFNNLFSRI